jgi:hypothetical protein
MSGNGIFVYSCSKVLFGKAPGSDSLLNSTGGRANSFSREVVLYLFYEVNL